MPAVSREAQVPALCQDPVPAFLLPIRILCLPVPRVHEIRQEGRRRGRMDRSRLAFHGGVYGAEGDAARCAWGGAALLPQCGRDEEPMAWVNMA